MAYSLHITKQDIHFVPEDGKYITQREWKSLFSAFPELSPAQKIVENGMELSLHDTLIAKWDTPHGRRVWFKFWQGNISVVGPDEETIQKMKQIATFLHAKVQGDDGEFY